MNNPETRRLIFSWVRGAFLGLIAYGALLLFIARRWDWPWGWAYILLTGLAFASHVILLAPRNPELLAERARGVHPADVKTWDRWITILAGGLAPMASLILASLEFRYNWTGAKPLVMHLTGGGIYILGWAQFLWAMASNPFFSEGVRIQHERGHTVAQKGPYRWVRHPGYIGSILIILGPPLLLGSWWGLLPAALGASGFVLRTALEDRTLRIELDGYTEYSRQVRYRLFPGIW